MQQRQVLPFPPLLSSPSFSSPREMRAGFFPAQRRDPLRPVLATVLADPSSLFFWRRWTRGEAAFPFSRQSLYCNTSPFFFSFPRPYSRPAASTWPRLPSLFCRRRGNVPALSSESVRRFLPFFFHNPRSGSAGPLFPFFPPSSSEGTS